jgi:hypothetical protein
MYGEAKLLLDIVTIAHIFACKKAAYERQLKTETNKETS